MGDEVSHAPGEEQSNEETEAGTGAGTGASAGAEALLTPAEVAALFGVDPTTVTNWANAGKLRSIKTLGGHRRFRASEVHSRVKEWRALPDG